MPTRPLSPRPETRAGSTRCAGPLLGALFLVLLSSCGRDDAGGGEGWQADIVEEDGVRTVRTLSGSVWGGTATLSEELSIGSADGSDAYLLGSVGSLWYADGRIFAADRDVPVVRVYGPDGAHVMDIGRKGAGPGEFDQPLSVRVDPTTGHILVRDDHHGRVNVYSHDGTYLEDWPLTTASFMTSYQMLMSDDGTAYTFGWFDFHPELKRRDVGYIKVDPQGVGGDTLMVPSSDYRPGSITLESPNMSIENPVPFYPDYRWAVGADGTIVYGVSEDYTFTVQHPDGTHTVVSRTRAEVRVDPDERAWYRARATANMRSALSGWAWNGPPVPDVKPAYATFWLDRAGRVWVLREGPGRQLDGCDPNPDDYSGFNQAPCWAPTWQLDVFDTDGRYLGPVQPPEGLQRYPEPYMGIDTVVLLVEDEAGVPVIKKYRLVLPE